MNQLVLPKLNRRESIIRNTLIGQDRSIPVNFGGNEYVLMFHHIEEPFPKKLMVEGQLDEHPIFVQFEDMFDLVSLSKGLQGVDIDTIDNELKGAILDSLFEPLLEKFQLMTRFKFRLKSFKTSFNDSEVDAGLNRVQFLLRGNKEGNLINLRGEVRAPLVVLEEMAKMVSSIPLTLKQKFDFIPYVVSLEIGHTQLDFNSYKGVKVDDIILLDNSKDAKSRICFGRLLGKRGLRFKANYDNNSVKVIDMMNEESYDENEMDLDSSAGDLPVELVFEVGRKTLAMKELMAMSKGYTFPLDNSIGDEVTIRANGKAVGRGQLVDIENKVGVRVEGLTHDE